MARVGCRVGCVSPYSDGCRWARFCPLTARPTEAEAATLRDRPALLRNYAQHASLEDIRDAATAALPPHSTVRDGLAPYDDQAKKVLELTFREALRLGHYYVGTEHILLALLEGRPDGALPSLGLAKVDIEKSIIAQLQKLS